MAKLSPEKLWFDLKALLNPAKLAASSFPSTTFPIAVGEDAPSVSSR